MVQSRRDKRAAKKAFRKLLKGCHLDLIASVLKQLAHAKPSAGFVQTFAKHQTACNFHVVRNTNSSVLRWAQDSPVELLSLQQATNTVVGKKYESSRSVTP
jgi:hypothetical protein